MIEYRGAFLSRGALSPIVDALALRFPQVFQRERLRVVGVDVAPQRITDANGAVVEPLGGSWCLRPGAYQMRFDFQVPKAFDEGPVQLHGYWRSSNHRCGVGGGAVVWPSGRDSFLGGVLEGREVIGNYHVYNPFGVCLDVGAAVVQFAIQLRGSTPVVSEQLRPKRVERFLGAGIIGKERTVLPPTEIVTPKNGLWRLEKDSPYYVEFDGVVNLVDEVLTPRTHLTDQLINPQLFLLAKHSCLGDPGYQGPLGMTVISRIDSFLSPLWGITRVAKHPILPIGERVAYRGQWQGEAGDERRIEFRPFHLWPELTSPATETTLESLAAKLL